jgi:hypothetical protein
LLNGTVTLTRTASRGRISVLHRLARTAGTWYSRCGHKRSRKYLQKSQNHDSDPETRMFNFWTLWTPAFAQRHRDTDASRITWTDFSAAPLGAHCKDLGQPLRPQRQPQISAKNPKIAIPTRKPGFSIFGRCGRLRLLNGTVTLTRAASRGQISVLHRLARTAKTWDSRCGHRGSRKYPQKSQNRDSDPDTRIVNF